MIFCKNCFIDQEVQNIIVGLNNVGNCPICGSKNINIYDTDKNTELTESFESLLEIYTPKAELPNNYPKEKLRFLKEELNQNWNIFNEKISLDEIYEIVKNICSELYKTNSNLFDGYIGIEEFANVEYIKNNSIIKNNTWEDFVEHIKYKNRFHIDSIEPRIFNDFFNKATIQYKKGDVFYRARISDKQGFGPSEMSAPNRENVKNGRANSEGIRCLYLASNLETTIHEVRANIFDYVTIGTFVLQKDIVVVDFRSINNISPFAIEDLTKYAINKPILEKINNEIAKSVSRNDSILNYLPTQYICDYIKSIRDNKTGQNIYAGIEYSSTTYPKGYNLAIFDPDLFKCENAKVYRINSIDYSYKCL